MIEIDLQKEARILSSHVCIIYESLITELKNKINKLEIELSTEKELNKDLHEKLYLQGSKIENLEIEIAGLKENNYKCKVGYHDVEDFYNEDSIDKFYDNDKKK